MKRRRPTNADKEKYWRAVMDRFLASKLPFRKFCEAEGISPNTFQAWRRELRLRDEQRGLKSTITKGANAPSQTSEKSAFWLGVIREINQYPRSISSFLRERGLSSGSLWYWEKRLIKEGKTTGVVTKARDDIMVPVKVIDETSTLQAAWQGEKTGSASGTKLDARIEVRSASGTAIFFPTDTSLETLVLVANRLGGK